MKPLKVSCPNSPTKSHILRVNNSNLGKCQCGYQKQFPVELMQPVYTLESLYLLSRERELEMVMQEQRSRLARDWEW